MGHQSISRGDLSVDFASLPNSVFKGSKVEPNSPSINFVHDQAMREDAGPHQGALEPLADLARGPNEAASDPPSDDEAASDPPSDDEAASDEAASDPPTPDEAASDPPTPDEAASDPPTPDEAASDNEVDDERTLILGEGQDVAVVADLEKEASPDAASDCD